MKRGARYQKREAKRLGRGLGDVWDAAPYERAYERAVERDVAANIAFWERLTDRFLLYPAPAPRRRPNRKARRAHLQREAQDE